MSKNRVNVTSTVTYQSPDLPTISVDTRFSELIHSDNQPLYRIIKVPTNGQWIDLENGWIETCSRLWLSNEERVPPERIPTEEERQAVAGRILTIGINTDAGVIPFATLKPGQGFSISPTDFKNLKLKADPTPLQEVKHIKVNLLLISE
jgi:hypothetical protein